MSNYFSQSKWISNSFLKRITACTMPPNIDKIFEFGSLVHAAIFEPHLANTRHVDYDLAQNMRDTFYKDWLCKIIMDSKGVMPEHEFYKRANGIYMRCKADAWVKNTKLILEFKGLGVTNEAGFREAITRFDYDMAAAFYIDTTGADRELIVAVSKKQTDKLFRFMVDRGDETYKKGREKYKAAIKIGIEKGVIYDKHIYDYDLLYNFLNPEN